MNNLIKERPILFSGPMVRALLADTKTQTRRLVKPYVCSTNASKPVPADLAYLRDFTPYRLTCPYGKPGDRLWVRETWQGPLLEEFETDADPEWMSVDRIHQYLNPTHCQYAADGGPAPEFMDADDNLQRRWRPSIHMPRWASRILLEVTEVRVERLQDISEADAVAEGCTENHNGYFWGGPHQAGGLKQMATPKQAYRDLWDSINGIGAWDTNPWVWAVSFKRIEP